MIDDLYRRVNTALAVKEQLALRKRLASESGDDAMAAGIESLTAAIDDWQTSVTTPDRKTNQDVLNFPPKLDAFLINLYQQVDGALLGVTDGQEARYRDLREQWNVALDRWNALIEDRIVPYSETAGPAILVPAWQ